MLLISHIIFSLLSVIFCLLALTADKSKLNKITASLAISAATVASLVTGVILVTHGGGVLRSCIFGFAVILLALGSILRLSNFALVKADRS